MNQTLQTNSEESNSQLWLNFAKLLLGVALGVSFLLSSQLGLNLFSREPQILAPPCPTCAKEFGHGDDSNSGTEQSLQTLTSSDSSFRLTFVPIVRERQITSGQIQFSQYKHRPLTKNTWTETHKFEPPNNYQFPFPLEKSRPVQTPEFKLSQLIANPSDGYYCLEYQVLFPDAKIQSSPKTKGAIYLLLQTTAPLRFGDIPIVEGQDAPFPLELREGTLTNSDPNGALYRKGSDEALPLARGALEIDQRNKRFRAVGLRYNPRDETQNYFEMHVNHTNSQGVPQQAIISFVVQRNRPPQVRTGADTVQLYYPKNAYSDRRANYQYFDLDMFIIDPDGVPDLRPSEISVLSLADSKAALNSLPPEFADRVSSNYQVTEASPGPDLAGNPLPPTWRLRIVDLNKLPRRNDFHVVVLRCVDKHRVSAVSIPVIITNLGS